VGVPRAGSLVAIDPAMRESYAKTLGPLIKPEGKILLVTVSETERERMRERE